MYCDETFRCILCCTKRALIMSSQPKVQRLIRFGLFEFDLAAGDLRKQGRKIQLQDQPFHVLERLLNRPGEVITREELQQALWPADTFVEFDQGLNTAIKKIRVALGDSAENPRFVETIPRKGYRFIAPVQGYAAPSVVAPRTGRRRFPSHSQAIQVARFCRASHRMGTRWHLRGTPRKTRRFIPTLTSISS